MKWLLALALTATMFPQSGLLDYRLVVNGEDEPWCEVTAEGAVEVRAVTYYNHEDPEWIGKPLMLDSGAFILEDDSAAVFPNVGPVAMRVYARPAGTDERFRNKGGCGSVPPRDPLKAPRNTTQLEECVVEFNELMEFYAWSYYLTVASENPTERFRYRTRNAEAESAELNISRPVAVSWYYRSCGRLVNWMGDSMWKHAVTCGEIPE